MKVVVQIPCFNEVATIAKTVNQIPRQVEGIESVEILVVDDGSSDATANVALELGVDHIVRHRRNRGLSAAFCAGIDACLRLGADIIVNIDADNQYSGQDIPALILPIVHGKADIVIGDRETRNLPHFPPTKKVLQAIGSMVVRRLSGTNVPDAVSGFRAFSREAALQLNIITSFTYTVESLIHAGKQRLAITSIPVCTNPTTRRSRLFKSTREYIARSIATMLRIYAMYQPLKVFFVVSALFMLTGAVPIIRFLYFFLSGDGTGHVQSLVLGGLVFSMGFFTCLIGLVADLVSINRRLLEMTLNKVRKIELAQLDQDSCSHFANREESHVGLSPQSKVRSLEHTRAK